MGGVSPGAGAQGTKDGPLGVGPIPVLSEPLGSSISDHGSAGLSRCRDPPFASRSTGQTADLLSTGAPVGPIRCPQICRPPTAFGLRIRKLTT